MDDSQLAKLEKIIKKGRVNYILVVGVLSWGVVTALLFSLLQHFTGTPQSFGTVAVSLVVSALGGMLWGGFMWNYLKKRYDKALVENT